MLTRWNGQSKVQFSEKCDVPADGNGSVGKLPDQQNDSWLTFGRNDHTLEIRSCVQKFCE